LVVTFGEISPKKRSRQALNEHPPKDAPKEMWWIANGGSSPAWWDSNPGETELKKRDVTVPYAEVGVMAEFANGSRKPVYMTFFWDREAKRWWLEYLCQYNIDESDSIVLIW